MHSKREKLPFGWGQAPGILTTFPPEDSLGLLVCDRGYVQGEKTTEIVFVAICLRLTHFVHKMPVLLSPEGTGILTQMLGSHAYLTTLV